MADNRKHRTVELDGDRIARLMRDRGWSIEELAGQAVISAASISKILHGKHRVYWSTAGNLKEAFELDCIDELLLGKKSPAGSDPERIHEWLFDASLSKWVTASNGLQFRVWRLKHQHLSKYARGKCYDLEGMASAEREGCRNSLLRHAEVCTRIGTHAHIINNLTTCESQSHDRWWVIDEWVEGTTLGDLLNTATLSTLETQKVIRQIAEGLNAFHSHGIVRRELSPTTILIRENSGDVVLTEFELAKLLDGSPTVSSSDWPVDPYRAPEATTDEIGRQADIYSWGRIAIQLLAATLPEKGEEKKVVVATGLPKKIETMLLKCVSVSWRARPKNFDAVLKVLHSWK